MNMATISGCRTYRYTLSRTGIFGDAPAVFLMLNPSTADATVDDPTIRRCLGFAATWGRNGIIVANLYALRATKPKDLWTHPDPVGPENDWWLAQIASRHPEIVCAWGANAKPARVREVAGILRAHGSRLMCLGTTKDGAPRHPLYVRADQPLVEYREAAA